MSLLISYPANISGLAGSMHDLNKSLRNPEPKQDWKLGDIAWVYSKSTRRIVTGPLVYIDSADGNTDRNNIWCEVHDITARSGDADSIHVVFAELFPSIYALNKAMFARLALSTNCDRHKGFAWFDFDGTLCAPIFQNEEKTVFGFGRNDWVKFCEREGTAAYNNCVLMEPVIQYARALREGGFHLGVLTAKFSMGEEAAKRAWLKTHALDNLFEEVVFVRHPAEKIPFMLQYATQNQYRPDQIVLIEDLYDTVLCAISAGMVGIHTSHIITGAVSIPF